MCGDTISHFIHRITCRQPILLFQWYIHFCCTGYNYCIYISGITERPADEFWDYERQIDLEAFDSRQVYDILSAQSKQATLTLAKQKDEVSFIKIIVYYPIIYNVQHYCISL